MIKALLRVVKFVQSVRLILITFNSKLEKVFDSDSGQKALTSGGHLMIELFIDKIAANLAAPRAGRTFFGP